VRQRIGESRAVHVDGKPVLPGNLGERDTSFNA